MKTRDDVVSGKSVLESGLREATRSVSELQKEVEVCCHRYYMDIALPCISTFDLKTARIGLRVKASKGLCLVSKLLIYTLCSRLRETTAELARAHTHFADELKVGKPTYSLYLIDKSRIGENREHGCLLAKAATS